jgi:hypothetical protein
MPQAPPAQSRDRAKSFLTDGSFETSYRVAASVSSTGYCICLPTSSRARRKASTQNALNRLRCCF